MTAYAACLRISEVAHLKTTDIDSQRMVIRVNQGKNRRGRFVMLSTRLLEILRTYWLNAHLATGFFPARSPDTRFPLPRSGSHATGHGSAPASRSRLRRMS
jgi:integrase